MAIARARSSSHRDLRSAVTTERPALCWPSGRMNDADVTCNESKKRGLQMAHYDMLEGRPGSRFRDEDRAWPPHRARSDRNHEKPHSHDHHRHEDKDHNTNDDDGDDDDGDKDDENDDDGDDDSDKKDDSESHSSSASGNPESGITSSVLANFGGVNIGNTITIINFGAGSQASQSGSPDNWPTKALQNLSSPTVSKADRSAITAAAVQAFCDSNGCSTSKDVRGAVTGAGTANFSMMPLGGDENREASKEAAYKLPAVSGAVKLDLARWLLLATTLVLLG
ncbi:unnamed protein product [Phytophthora lilii]|uniref:Unnamed protein product n=1 Tax=Phytophthora lilii TaxID=2077276 RepID=A0A9W6TD82_9STRA|nr:unnamed protein product [Phytophthora lilii]